MASGDKYPSKHADNGEGDSVKAYGDYPDIEKEPYKATYSIDKENKVTAQLTFFCQMGAGIETARQYMQGEVGHPYIGDDSGDLVLTPVGATVTGQEGHETVTVTFNGVAEDGEWKPKFIGGTKTEPIDTHPEFQGDPDDDDDGIGGKFEGEKHGAIFDPNKAFKKFSNYIDRETQLPDWATGIEDYEEIEDSGGKCKNPFAGVKSYLDCGLTWEESKFFVDADQLKYLMNAGTRMEPVCDDPFPPKVKTKSDTSGGGYEYRDWLNMGASWTMVGNGSNAGCKVTVKFQLSGPRGWDEDIYDDDVEAGTNI